MRKKAVKRAIPASPYRKSLASNLNGLMRATPELSSSPKLHSRTNLSTGTINRIRRGETATDLDTLTALAEAFDLQPWQLLVPEMNPTNPPVIPSLTDEEKALYAKLAEAAKAVVAISDPTQR